MVCAVRPLRTNTIPITNYLPLPGMYKRIQSLFHSNLGHFVINSSLMAYPTVPYTDKAQSLRRGDETLTHHLSVTFSHRLLCRPSHYGIIIIL